jgi:hypothetical protein
MTILDFEMIPLGIINLIVLLISFIWFILSTGILKEKVNLQRKLFFFIGMNQ